MKATETTKNLKYIKTNLEKTFGVKMNVTKMNITAFFSFAENIDKYHLESDLQIYCAKFGYTCSGLSKVGSKNCFAIYFN